MQIWPYKTLSISPVSKMLLKLYTFETKMDSHGKRVSYPLVQKCREFCNFIELTDCRV